MTARLGDVESQMQSLAQRNFSLKDDLATIETDLQDALTERNTALMQSTQMRRDIKVLENKLVNLEDQENDTVERLTDQAEMFISSMEQLVEMAGLDVEDLMAGDEELVAGQGGPFIELQGDGRPAGRLKAKLQNLENRLAYSDSLQTVIKKMPFTPPLHGYYITSKFGKRRDPLNKRWAMHYGLDFGSSPHAGIYVTAPGKVVYAGWRGVSEKWLRSTTVLAFARGMDISALSKLRRDKPLLLAIRLLSSAAPVAARAITFIMKFCFATRGWTL